MLYPKCLNKFNGKHYRFLIQWHFIFKAHVLSRSLGASWLLLLVPVPRSVSLPTYIDAKREQARRILFIILKLSRVLLTTLEWNNNTNHLPTEGSQPLDLSSLYSWHRAQYSQKKWGTQLGFGGWGRSNMFRCLVLHVHDIISGIPMKQFIPCRFIEYRESHRLRMYYVL